jgi:hypothetical protein
MPLDPKIQAIVDRLNARTSGTAKPMVVHENQMQELTVAELRTLCQANPNHQAAAIMLAAVAQHPAGEKVVVEKVQLDAIVQNKDVVADESDPEVKRKMIDPAEVTGTTPDPDA